MPVWFRSGLHVVPFALMFTSACAPGYILDPPGQDAGREAGPHDVVASEDVPQADSTRIDVLPRVDAPTRDTGTADTPRDTSMGTPDTGVACTTGCPANAHCVGTSCQCDPYFVASGAACTGIVPGDPASHGDSDVCAQWSMGHVTNAARAYDPGATMCDPGSLSRDALNDALRRMNMFRWLVGLTPATDDSTMNTRAQSCSLMEHLKGWPGASNPDPHHPAPDWPCYTADGAAGAGSSNISWGAGSAADAMDNWMQDSGNDTTLGHRRWILHPPLGPVGLGFVGDASCLGVFASGGGGTSGDWYAYPPPGAVPTAITTAAWSWHTPRLGISAATVAITRMSDGASLAVRRLTLSQGYADDTMGWFAMGWSPVAGQSYQVTVSGLTGSTTSVSYTVRPISCP